MTLRVTVRANGQGLAAYPVAITTSRGMAPPTVTTNEAGWAEFTISQLNTRGIVNITATGTIGQPAPSSFDIRKQEAVRVNMFECWKLGNDVVMRIRTERLSDSAGVPGFNFTWRGIDENGIQDLQPRQTTTDANGEVLLRPGTSVNYVAVNAQLWTSMGAALDYSVQSTGNPIYTCRP